MSRLPRFAFTLLFAALLVFPAVFAGCGGESEPEELTLFKEAAEAIQAGDKTKGMELLNQCIELKPSHYAYLERAKLHMDAKSVPEAIADCKKGLELAPGNRELTWLLGELEKPAPQRFQGQLAQPPSSRK